MMIRDMIRNGAIGPLAFSLLAAGMAIAADRPVDPQVKPAERLVTTEVRFIEMKGIDWINDLKTTLKPVRMTPGFKVWTSEREINRDLVRLAGEISIVQAPKVTSYEGSTASIVNNVTQKYVAAGHWEFQGGGAAFRPTIGELSNGISVKLSARKLDQGMLVRVNIDDQRLLGLETVAIPARVNHVNINAQIQIPQTTKLQQEGEWLIPDGGMLLLSTGCHHAEPPRRKTNVPLVDELLDGLGVTAWLAERAYWSSPVVERLVVIDAKSVVLEAEGPVRTSAVLRP